MDISYAFFAEAAQITSDGRVNVLGADLPILQFQGQPPWVLPSIYFLVSIRLEREDCGRLYHLTADMVTPDGRKIDPHVENTFVAPLPDNPELIARMSIVLQLQGVAFPVPGSYHMHVLVEDRERNVSQEKRVRLRVTEAASQNQPA